MREGGRIATRPPSAAPIGIPADQSILTRLFDNRSGRVIAVTRLMLAAAFLLALWIDPNQPARSSAAGYSILAGYLVLAVALCLIAWRSWWWDFRLAWPSHVVDILAFLSAVFFTEGAIGFGVTQPRHFVNGSLALSGPGYGVRLNGTYRSASTLQSGSLAAPDELRFASLFTANLRTFVELDSIWPKSTLLKQTRVSLGINNLANRRQTVTDASGTVPLRFQPAYRDAVGRTLEIELRKVF